MAEWILSRTMVTQKLGSWASGTFASAVCWTCGISVVAGAVLFSVAGGAATRIFGMTGLALGSMMCGLAKTAPPWLKRRMAGALISSVTMLLICEVAMRVMTNFPVNMTSNRIPHSSLGYVLDPAMDDVDEAGFRNPRGVKQVSIAAIGDSHTQGVNAESGGSWPQQLARHLNASVYNYGIGGYGPLQYSQLIDEALKRQPNLVVVGLYLGNDLGDVVRGIQQQHTEQEIDNSFRHALKYHTAIGSASAILWSRSAAGRTPGFEVRHPVNPTYISHKRVLQHSEDVDLSTPALEEAFQTTIRILTDAQSRCRNSSAELLVMLIPTRESVYFQVEQSAQAGPFYAKDSISGDSGPELLEQFAQLARRETNVRNHFLAVLSERGIAVIDLLPNLAQAVSKTPGIYADYDEGHPLRAGYAVYAAAVESWIQSHRAVSTN